jgi:hypothetical protein
MGFGEVESGNLGIQLGKYILMDPYLVQEVFFKSEECCS